MYLEALPLLCFEQESSGAPPPEKLVLCVRKQKEGKLSLGYMVHRTFSLKIHRLACTGPNVNGKEGTRIPVPPSWTRPPRQDRRGVRWDLRL
jgi:hypothetical protein